MSRLLSRLTLLLFRIPVIKMAVIYFVRHVTHRRKGVPDGWAALLPVTRSAQVSWCRNSLPLSDSTVAVVTTAGIFVKGQEAFKEGLFDGDFSYRALHRDLAVSKFSFSRSGMDCRLAMLDFNLLFPIQRLMELKKSGVIRDVAMTHYSFFSHSFRTNRIIDGSGKEVARRLRYEGVDKVLVMTSSVLSQELAFLVQRSIEEEGIPTVSLAYTPEAVKALKPPRACLLGPRSLVLREEYLDADLQMNLVRFMLNEFERITEPGSLRPVALSTPAPRREPIPPAEAVSRPAAERPRDKGPQKDLFEDLV